MNVLLPLRMMDGVANKQPLLIITPRGPMEDDPSVNDTTGKNAPAAFSHLLVGLLYVLFPRNLWLVIGDDVKILSSLFQNYFHNYFHTELF